VSDPLKDLNDVAGVFAPLGKVRSPATAAVIGFLFGGLGLGIYFRSFIDFIIPIAVVIFASAFLHAAGVVGGAVAASCWGYFRALNSNAKLAASPAPSTVR
jgi:hypothetical protein